MQNPFLRFKHYQRSVIHPYENHATETLAATLLLSPNIKREFLRFLFEGQPPFEDIVAESFDVSTQGQIGAYGIVDLLLELPGRHTIVVEEKVNAPEDATQIRTYRKWLDKTKQGATYVFSLPRHAYIDVRSCG